MSEYEIDKEFRRLRKLPMTVVLDYIRSNVSRLFMQIENLNSQLKTKVGQNSTEKQFQQDDFTLNVMRKNDFLLKEKDRLTAEVENLAKDNTSNKEKCTELKIKIEKMKEQIELNKLKHQEQLEQRDIRQ